MKKPTRTPRHQVNRRQKAIAIKALSEIVESNAQPYVRAKAAAALLNSSEGAPDPRVELVDPDAPRVIFHLPQKDGGTRPLGPQEDSNIVIFDDTTPEGRADLARWRAEAEVAGHKVLAPQ